MPPGRHTRTVQWWSDPKELPEKLTDDEEDTLSTMRSTNREVFESREMTSREMRACLRLMRRGLMVASFRRIRKSDEP